MAFLRIQEPVNTWTHFITFLAGLVGLIILLVFSWGKPPKLFTMLIFGLSVLILYGASTMYHWVKANTRKKRLLRKMDHMSIFILIAGTYTPILYYGLGGKWRLVMLITIWTLALVGAVLKLFFSNIPRSLSTFLYVFLGWLAIIPFFKLLHTLPIQAIVLMIAGGVAYTLGALIYATKTCNFFPNKFGFHEIFHLFVSAGSVLHFVMIGVYILPI